MERKSRISRRLFATLVVAVVGVATILGLVWLDGQMDVRYQAVGMVTDDQGAPLAGVEAVLMLAPPPMGTRRDALFASQAAGEGGKSGPVVGLSGLQGTYVVRATGRTGAARAIRLGLDTNGRPPFEMAWLVLRKAGYMDEVRTVSILGWQTSPPHWGEDANRLPLVVMDPADRE